MRFTITLILTLGVFLNSIGGGIKGTIRKTSGIPLAHPYISVKGQLVGTIANETGEYQLSLSPGQYELVYQHEGYFNKTIPVEIGENYFLQLDIELEAQMLIVKEPPAKSEDPAYAIMRHAIAKAQFHQLQLKSYTAKSYARTTVNPVKIPYVLQRGLKKQGVRQGQVFINESISDIEYERSNKYYQRLLAAKNSVDNSIPAPNEYLLASFYNPTVVGTLSPLAPKSFSYYSFEHEGYFEEDGIIVNRIKIIPKAYGEGVFKGTISIIENSWAIYSFNLETTSRGIGIKINQFYKPVEQVWVPVCQYIKLDGAYLGFMGELKYLVSIHYTNIDQEPISIIKSTERERIDKELFNTTSSQKIAYHREDKRIVRQDITIEDPKAKNQSSDYWIAERPVPLNEWENNIYIHQDTNTTDTKFSISKPDSSHFKLIHFLTGKTYNFPKNNSFYFKSPVFSISYNTVEGNALNILTAWEKKWKGNKYLKISPLARYTLGSKKMYGDIYSTYGTDNWNVRLSGGKILNQYNSEFPISNLANSIASRFFDQSLMKLYQSQYVRGELNIKDYRDVFQFQTSIGVEKRKEVYNLKNAKPIFIWDRFGFSPNIPINSEMESTNFEPHTSVIWEINAQFSPWRKYTLKNGTKKYFSDNTPTFDLTFKQGIPINTFNDFTFLQAGIRHELRLGPRNTFSYRVNTGGFMQNKDLKFVDYKHFADNEFFIQFGDPLSEFRMLPRYKFSTSKWFYEAHALLSMRRFLLTQFQTVRLSGITENLQFHHLHTPTLPNYSELVYGLDNIYRVFRVELVSQFIDNRFQSIRIRIGTSLPVSNIKR